MLPVLKNRCGECHGGDEPASNVDLTRFDDDRTAARQRKLWRRALAQLEAGTMPPKDAAALEPAERETLLRWMDQSIRHIDPQDPANRDPGPALLRRLSVREYNRTIRDLLGFEFDAASSVGMTDDVGETGGYANMAAGLDVSPALLEKYFAAADDVLDRLLGTELNSFVDGNIQEAARHARERMFGVGEGQWRKADFVVAPAKDIEPREAARRILEPVARRAYRGQATPQDIERLLAIFDRASAQELSYVDSVRHALKAVLVAPKFLYRVESDRPDVAAGEAAQITDLELASRLSYFLWFSMPDDELLDLAARGKLSASGASDEPVRVAGTIIGAAGSETMQGNNRDKVFDRDLATIMDGPTPDSYWIGLDFGRDVAMRRIRFAARRGYEGRMVGGAFQASSQGDFSGDVSDLFTVTEQPPSGWVERDLPEPKTARYVRYVPPKNSFGNIAEFEVRAVAEGTVLEQQVRRMLVDPRARSLTEDFAARWLQLTRLPTARPSTEFFPDFNSKVRQAMYDETTLFVDGLRSENRSVLELLDADYTYLNEDLAKFYGIPDVSGPGMRRVALRTEHHRGGLLGMGSILALTSHTSRTSPTLRGRWILDVLWGAPPPPPPANAGQIKDEKDKAKEATSFREKLAQHAHDATCAACHRKMDPLGFALDNYNAVGIWRDNERDRPLDVTGELPGGQKLNGAADVRQVVMQRKEIFLRNLAEQMLTYALGRPLDFYDDGPVLEIVGQLEGDGYRFQTLVMGIVKSYPFQYRRE